MGGSRLCKGYNLTPFPPAPDPAMHSDSRRRPHDEPLDEEGFEPPSKSSRKRVGSEIARSELTIEAIRRIKIFQYFNK